MPLFGGMPEKLQLLRTEEEIGRQKRKLTKKENKTNIVQQHMEAENKIIDVWRKT